MMLRWDTIISDLPDRAGKRIGGSRWLHASALSSRLRADLASVLNQPHDVPADDLVIRIDEPEGRVATTGVVRASL